jgi:pyruvate dehydrogenase (quinone)
MRHEEGAAFAAGAEAHVTGELAVRARSCVPGNLRLINGLFENGGGVGIKGLRVEKPQDLRDTLTEAFRHDGPALVDVVSACEELVMPPKMTVDEAYHFGMFMMKAVLDGRAHEFIDSAKVNLTC